MAITYHSGGRIQGLSTEILNTPAYSDDFTSSGTTSHTSSPSTVGGWLAQDHTKILVNGSTDEITWQAFRSSNDNCSYDIGTALSDSAWIMDVDLEIDTLASGAGGENALLVYMSSVSSATASESNGDRIGFSLEKHSSYERIEAFHTDGSGVLGTGSRDNILLSDLEQKKYYVRIIRNTSTSYTVTVYDDVNRTEELATHTQTGINSTVSSLQYVVVGNLNSVHSLATNNLFGTISNIVVYDGVTSLTSKPTNVQLGSRFEETDTRKIYYKDDVDWKELGVAPTNYRSDSWYEQLSGETP